VDVSRPVATDPQRKAEALQRAAQVGVAQAAREFGIPAGTIRAWRHRSGEAGPPARVDVQDWAARKQQGAEDAWQAAQAALAKVTELLEAGKTGDAQRAALTMAITLDKSAMLEAGAQAAHDRDIRLRQENAALVAAVFELLLEAIGLRKSQAAKRCCADLLRQASRGEPMVVSPVDAEAVQAELRRRIGAELREEIEREFRDRVEPDWREQRGLPAPDAEREAEPVEPMAGPRTIVRTVSEPVEDEIAEAEVVEDEPLPAGWLNMYHDETRARRAWEQAKAEDRRREQREREKAAEPMFTEPGVSRSSSFDIDGPNSNMRPPGGKL
jgi:hypothetical protein